jgi:hypothetical protein
MPSAIEEAVASDVARLFVVFPGIERAAFVSPLLAAIVARDDGVVAHRLPAGHSHQGRPIAGARAVAGRLATSILVEDIQGHALVVSEHFALGAIAGFGWRHLRERDCRNCSYGSDWQHERFTHGLLLDRLDYEWGSRLDNPDTCRVFHSWAPRATTRRQGAPLVQLSGDRPHTGEPLGPEAIRTSPSKFPRTGSP